MLSGLAIFLFMVFVIGTIMIVILNGDKLKLLNCIHKQALQRS